MTRKIELSGKNGRGVYALVDDCDYDIVSTFKWHLVQGKDVGAKPYAVSSVGKKRLSMHRFVMGNPVGEFVDHKSGDTLDNRRSNLRACTHAENIANSKMRSDNKSGYKGVRVMKNGSYRARITFCGEKIYLGIYKRKEDAAKAYDEAAVKYFGEFALTNF